MKKSVSIQVIVVLSKTFKKLLNFFSVFKRDWEVVRGQKQEDQRSARGPESSTAIRSGQRKLSKKFRIFSPFSFGLRIGSGREP